MKDYNRFKKRKIMIDYLKIASENTYSSYYFNTAPQVEQNLEALSN